MSRDAADYTDLVPVFFGSYVEAVALRSALEAYGFKTFLPSENIKVADPFVTGANALDVRLDAPADVADEVRELIEELRPAEADRPKMTAGARTGWALIFLWMAGLSILFVVLALLRELWRLVFGD